MDKTLQLDIVTPDRIVLSEQVDYVSAHGAEGDFGILPGHVPLLAVLSTGILSYTVKGNRKNAFVSGGFAEVHGDRVTILAESSELADNIDLARAREALSRAEKRLEHQEENVNMERAKASLHRAVMRINIYNSR
ncbi:MAG: F0F1 ATP synthase subunit epsilon [Deltaproteobacteria bacterium]|jgi:F-type H+-transporting ATPase subunit epsilon|nr:F0F1 ATP synthase subunit epsilon [Deltaproteobacteria bacterium]